MTAPAQSVHVIDVITGLAEDGEIDHWERRLVGFQTVYEIDCRDWDALKHTLSQYGIKEHQTSRPDARRIYDPLHQSVGVYQPS